MTRERKKQYTPGEWSTVRDSKNPTDKLIVGRRNFVIAACPDGDDKAENNANARLIAAAPDLLEALQNVVDDWTQQFERYGHMAPVWCRNARQAIEKATTPDVKKSLTACAWHEDRCKGERK